MSDFPGGIPTRQQLDAVVADRPVILPNSDYHGAWANTRALELAGIGRDTPDPFGGRIERDQHGEPVGMLQESAMGLVLDLAPKPDAEQRAAGLRTAQEYYHRLGITACQDATVEPDYQETYERLARSGELTLRVRGNLSWNPALGDEQLDQLIERRLSGTVGRLTCGNVKFFHDGVVENRTAAMLDPYLDAAGAATGEYGIDQYRLEDLARHVARCDAAGFGIHIHAIGDRAVRESLDVLEQAAAANGRRDARHQLAHVQFAHPRRHPPLPQPGRDRERDAALGPARVLHRRAHDPVHLAGRRRHDLPLRQHPAGRRRARVRQRLDGLDTRPAAPAGHRRRPHRPRDQQRRSRCCPTSGSTWAARSPRRRSAPRTPRSWTTRRARSSPASWPTWWCSTATCSGCRRPATSRPRCG